MLYVVTIELICCIFLVYIVNDLVSSLVLLFLYPSLFIIQSQQ